MNALEKSLEAEGLRVNLVQKGLELEKARDLMKQMDAKYRALKGNEARLIEASKLALEIFNELRSTILWKIVPKKLRKKIDHWLGEE